MRPANVDGLYSVTWPGPYRHVSTTPRAGQRQSSTGCRLFPRPTTWPSRPSSSSGAQRRAEDGASKALALLLSVRNSRLSRSPRSA